ncbi:hypothetical protein [Aeromonas caviae]|uniref:hypothetical protein n=1 Tax=Aeromonas caviae TaxID=648 RepID=UPI001CC7A7B6|nr:hypothetical protein [Aeromonas caviae]GJA46868.1 hypothetical protein KAM346_31570 [Aeromonas caviae]
MKKTLIALAIAGLSFNAMAVDLDGKDAAALNVQKYASELKVPAAGLELKKVSLTSKIGFALSTDAYVRLNLSDAVTVSGVTASSTGSTGSAAVTWAVADSGPGYVILKNDGKGVKSDDVLTVNMTVKVADKKDVTVKYDLYGTAGNAVGQTGSLKTKQASLLSFVSALKVTAKADAALKKIDVTDGSKTFESGAIATNLVNLVAKQDPLVLGASGFSLLDGDGDGDGVAATIPGVDLTDKAAWFVSGPFVEGTTVGGVAIDKDNVGKKLDVTASAATVIYQNAAGKDAKVLVEGAVNAEYVPSSALATSYDFSTYKFDGAAQLVKNGDKAEVNLALNPNGAYSQYVRISNKSAQAGAVFVTVIADDGKAVNFPLSAIAGQPASLDAGASTVQLTLKDIYAAAEAKGLTLTGDKKIRLLVDAQVPAKGLSVQSYTLSKDGNSFATMNAF